MAIGAVLQMIDQLYKMQRVSAQDLDEAADRLMGQVLGQVTEELAKLLGTSRITTSAADLTYRGADGLVRFCESDSDKSGTLETIGAYFRKHVPQRRMVILGEAGSGKTMLALELVTQLLRTREDELDPQRRAPLPVPIRFSLPTWDTNRTLKQWLTSQVAAQYGTSDKLAQRLVDDYRILPVLDGLDEMDPSTGPPVRATEAVTQLNAYLIGRAGAPTIVTCRTDEYRLLGEKTGLALRPAREISILPLNADQIRGYIDHEYDSSATVRRRDSWNPVLDRLSDPEDPRPLLVLQTAWRLTLAVSYHSYNGDLNALLPTPAEIKAFDDSGKQITQTDPYFKRIDDLLLSNFIPARTSLHPSHHYDPDDVVRWLRTTANYLGDRSDIILHELWPIAGPDRVRKWHLISATTGAAFLGVMTLVLFGLAVPEMSTPKYISRITAGSATSADYIGIIWTALLLVAVKGSQKPFLRGEGNGYSGVSCRILGSSGQRVAERERLVRGEVM